MLRFMILIGLSLSLWAVADSDAGIRTRLKAKLAQSKLSGDGLQFKVTDGTVEWDGVVAVSQHKGAATRMAKTAGATRVVNRIQVKGGAKPRAKVKATKQAPREVTVQVPKR